MKLSRLIPVTADETVKVFPLLFPRRILQPSHWFRELLVECQTILGVNYTKLLHRQ